MTPSGGRFILPDDGGRRDAFHGFPERRLPATRRKSRIPDTAIAIQFRPRKPYKSLYNPAIYGTIIFVLLFLIQ